MGEVSTLVQIFDVSDRLVLGTPVLPAELLELGSLPQQEHTNRRVNRFVDLASLCARNAQLLRDRRAAAAAKVGWQQRCYTERVLTETWCQPRSRGRCFLRWYAFQRVGSAGLPRRDRLSRSPTEVSNGCGGATRLVCPCSPS